MRQECINHKYSYGRDFPVGRLISVLGLKMQVCTQRYDRRPYGVGLLVAGYDVSFTNINGCKNYLKNVTYRIKDRTSIKPVQAQISMTAKQWPSVHVLKALEHTWRNI